jgi:hypothetical protein
MSQVTAGEEPYIVELVQGNPPTSRRGLSFLVCETDPAIDAKASFDGLNLKKERELRRRFNWWLNGYTNDDWFHGWPNNPTHKECFVFRWKEKRQHHRLYGFLCHPLISHRLVDYRRFQLCILTSHATKNSEHTDPRELDGVLRLKSKEEVREAIESVSKVIVSLLPTP